ncbi:MAG: alpha/beta hydrolase, partial [bacterium]
DNVVAEAKMTSLISDRYAAATPELRTALGPLSTQLAGTKQLTSPWFRYFLAYDPAPTLRQVTCPVLALNGSLDMQVASDVNLAAIAAALQAGGNTDVQTLEMPNLNHLFQTATTGSPVEYATIEETVAPSVLAKLVEWVGERTATK